MKKHKPKHHPAHRKPGALKSKIKHPPKFPTDQEYIDLFNACEIKKEWKGYVTKYIQQHFSCNKQVYMRISALVNNYNCNALQFSIPEIDPMPFSPLSVSGGVIPWYFIACLHFRESTFNFEAHLHNGDSLKDYTKKVPPGRPDKQLVRHGPEFSFEESAVDALIYMGHNKVTNWNLPKMLRIFEGWNGNGYFLKKMNSPYLWSFSSLYTKGLFYPDHVFNADLISKQLGTAVILKQMEALNLISIPRI